jgi:hypothetical protein
MRSAFASFKASPAADAFVWVKQNLAEGFFCFGVVTPIAVKWTALEKHRCSQARTVVHTVALYLGDFYFCFSAHFVL